MAALVLLVLAVPLGGCLGGGEDGGDPPAPPEGVPEMVPEPVVLLTDPEGDAVGHSSSSTMAQAWSACWAAEPVTSTACDEAPVVPDPAPGMGTPAPPGLDILSAKLEERPETLLFTLEVAQLSADLSEMGTDEVGDWAYLSLNFTSDAGPSCGGWLDHTTTRDTSGVFQIAFYNRIGEACGDGRDAPGCRVAWCAAAVPVEIEPGSPGRLHFHVPRHVAAGVEAGATLHHVGMFAESGEDWFGTQWGSYQANGPVRFRGSLGTYGFRTNDVGFGPEPFAVQLPSPQPPEPVPGPWSDTGTIDPWAAGDPAGPGAPSMGPDDDIRSFQLEETPTNLTVTVAFEDLPAGPSDNGFGWWMGLPTGGYGGGYTPGDRESNAFVIGSSEHGIERIPFTYREHSGPGGSLSFILNRSDLHPVQAGDPVWGAYAATFAYRHTEGTEAAGLNVTRVALGDISIPLGPTRLVHGSSGHAQTNAARTADAVGDAAVPGEALLAEADDASSFDITFLDVRTESADQSSMTLGVAELREVPIPEPYRAAFYGIGLTTDAGDHMVGYYREKGQSQGTFLCGPDATVLATNPVDPARAVWTPIQGAISLTASDGAGLGGGSGPGGSIAFDVPHTCLGVEEGQTPQVTRMVARTFLISDPAGDARTSTVSEPMDEVVQAQAFRMAPPPPPPRGWWDQVREGGSLWDLVGVVLAMLTVGVTVVLWWRRRHRFREYLQRIDRTKGEHAGDPAGLTEALHRIETDLERDLRRGRLPSDHFGVVQTRLRHERLLARADQFATEFRSLPIGLVKDLERYLHDGVLSPEDRARLLTEARREQIPARALQELENLLDLWVAQDVGEEAAP